MLDPVQMNLRLQYKSYRQLCESVHVARRSFPVSLLSNMDAPVLVFLRGGQLFGYEQNILKVMQATQLRYTARYQVHSSCLSEISACARQILFYRSEYSTIQ